MILMKNEFVFAEFWFVFTLSVLSKICYNSAGTLLCYLELILPKLCPSHWQNAIRLVLNFELAFEVFFFFFSLPFLVISVHCLSFYIEIILEDINFVAGRFKTNDFLWKCLINNNSKVGEISLWNFHYFGTNFFSCWDIHAKLYAHCLTMFMILAVI